MKEVYHITCSQGHKFEGNKETVRCQVCNEKVKYGWQWTVERKSDVDKDILFERIYKWFEEKYPNSYTVPLQDEDADFIGQMVWIAPWNDISDNMQKFIEKHYPDIVMGYEDEYSICSDCGKAILSIPQYYGDQGNYIYLEYEVLCKECAKNNFEDVIEYLMDNSNTAAKTWMLPLLEKYGFSCLENTDENEDCQIYATGWHHGQNDDPKKVEKWIKENMPKHNYIFALTDVGQFDCHWTVFVRPMDVEV